MKKFFVSMRLLFLSLMFFAFCLLLISRAGEVHTVWEFMNPLFIPLFFATTFLLVIIIFSSEAVRYKLIFTMLYSSISHSFSVVIFPAGSISGQETVLGITRLIYDNVIFHGWGGSVENVFKRVFNWINKPNFQSAYSVMFARMFGVDVFWVHLLLIPVLWGIFVPLLAFSIAKVLGLDENIAALSSLLASAFPLLVYWGTISVPNSLGYVFFLGCLYFCLKHFVSEEARIGCFMGIFAFASFLSHFLTGIISFAFLLMAVTIKRYEKERASSPLTGKFLLSISFIFSASLVPLALIYLQVFSGSSVHFGLSKIQDLAATEFIGLFLFGEYLRYSPTIALIHIVGPLLGLIGMLYAFYVSDQHKTGFRSRVLVLFLFLGSLIMFVEYRILKLFMVNLPFDEERIWVFRDFMMLPFAAFVIGAVVQFASKRLSGFRFFRVSPYDLKVTLKSFVRALMNVWLTVLVLIMLVVWIVASVYSAYPRYGPLQIMSYELEAVKYLKEVTSESYVVIGDLWIGFAGGMIVGLHNPKAFYFTHTETLGVELFNEMTMNPSRDVMIRAMNYTNVTVAYFVVTVRDPAFTETVQQTSAVLPVYRVFGEGNLHIFRYEKDL